MSRSVPQFSEKYAIEEVTVSRFIQSVLSRWVLFGLIL
jgi:hypothetical protein